MKTDFYASLYYIISNTAIFFCFVPIILVLTKKTYTEKAYLFTAIYWLANGLLNLPTWFGLATNNLLIHHLTLLYNMLDAPLVLMIFFFSSSYQKKKIIFYTISAFIFFELLITAWKGYNLSSSTIIIGAGTVLALVFSTIGIMEYLQNVDHSPFENTMVLVFASILFDYGIFIVIYLFSYLKIAYSKDADNYFIYYASLFISTTLSSLALWRYAGKEKSVPKDSLQNPFRARLKELDDEYL
ncbi:MAG: hypothetical protein JST87_07000 [Bacteroidetes bacterium]|nr:hypothetical protein [Bacteroidota bacterium]MBS1934889.1 hypothetical protein [Bacteroidota bacterium]